MKRVIFICLVLTGGMSKSKAHTPPAALPDSLEQVYSAFDSYVDFVYMKVGDTTLNKTALAKGLKGYYAMKHQKLIKDTSVLTIVDFTKPSTEERLYVIDPFTGDLKWKTLVSHGQKTGGLYAKQFSNNHGSHQSSYGFYVTGQRWNSAKLGECLQLYGKEYSNYKALPRGVIVHAADYVSDDFIKKYGRLGRSYGCPAVPRKDYDEYLNLIDEGTCYFIYYNNNYYNRSSKFLNTYDHLIEFGQAFAMVT